MSWLQRLAIGSVLALLQASVKNPNSLAKEVKILVEIRYLLNQILDGLGIPRDQTP